MQTPPLPTDLALTLSSFAARCGRPAGAVRDAYAARMRRGTGLELPGVTRVHAQADAVKLCVNVGTADGIPLEAEAVLVPMRGYAGTPWHTLCVSSQVGCRMGCPFCETGRMGLVQNLSADAIVAQYLVARCWGEPDAAGIRNVVFMGMGEPLDNLGPVVEALRVLNDPAGLAIPLSRVTLSTVGRPEGLHALARLAVGPPWSDLRLAISLHAATDARRDQLVPVNRGAPLGVLREALLAYPLRRRGRFLIQYVLLADVNDSLADADALAEWCRPLRCTVNVIPYNPQRVDGFARPEAGRVAAFLARVRAHGVFAKQRLTHGDDVFAACGQLGNPARRARGPGETHSGLQKGGAAGLRSGHHVAAQRKVTPCTG